MRSGGGPLDGGNFTFESLDGATVDCVLFAIQVLRVASIGFSKRIIRPIFARASSS